MISVFLTLYLTVELLESQDNSLLTFEELLGCFPKTLHHFTFPPAVYKGPVFLHPHQLLLLPVFFGHPGGYEVASCCGLDLRFPDG